MRFIWATFLVLLSFSVYCEDLEPQEVVVSASLRRSTLEQLPASVTVLQQDTLQSAGVQHFADVLGLIPNLNWSAGSSRPRFFQLRGIGELEQFQGIANPSVGFLIDGVDFSGIGMSATLFDVARVEVLRGPQSVIQGAEGLAGLINFETAAATPVSLLRFNAGLANYSTRNAGVVWGGALGSNDSAYRLVAQRFSSDGFRRNAFLQRDDTNGFSETTLRGKLHHTIGDSWQFDLSVFWVDIDNTYDAFAVDNSRVTQSNQPGRDAQLSKAFALKTQYQGSARYTLQNITSVVESDSVYSFDADWGNDLFWSQYLPYEYFSQYERQRAVLSTDWRWLFQNAVWGVSLKRTRENTLQQDLANGFTTLLDSRYHTLQTALYGEMNWSLTEKLQLQLGSRFERRRVEYQDSNLSDFSPTDNLWGANLALSWQRSPRTLWYATLAQGYKAGGVNLGQSVPVENRLFDDELLWSVELGLKTAVPEKALSTQLALFYMHRRDQQVNTSLQLVLGDPQAFGFLTQNAARGRNFGLEGSASWQIHPQWALTAGVGLLQADYREYVFSLERDLRGREQAHAPQYQASVALQYQVNPYLSARFDLQAVDNFYFDTSHDERSSAYSLCNLKLSYQRARWSADFWVRNLFSQDYAQRGFYFGLEPTGDPLDPQYPERRYIQPGDPRQLGISINYEIK